MLGVEAFPLHLTFIFLQQAIASTIILTGANGSAGIHAAEHLLKTYPEFTAIFTVRSAADTDVNTENLRRIISEYPGSHASVHQVDLADLSAVHQFASTVSVGIVAGQYPPLKSIICNASYWNLVGDPELTVDNYDKTTQIVHIAHVALVLRLIGSFSPDGGRVVLVSSIGHFRKKDTNDPMTLDEITQQKVWKKSAEWAKITKDNTALGDKLE